MGFLSELLKHGDDLRRVYDEAQRLEAAHFKAKGWTHVDGRWIAPGGGAHPEAGPGTIVSLLSQVETAAKNVGVDLAQFGPGVEKAKQWIAQIRQRTT